MWYAFHQNNSHGVFQGPAALVNIEADSPDEANLIALKGDIYFDGCYAGDDCDCCGDRWYPVNEYDGQEEPAKPSDVMVRFCEEDNVPPVINIAKEA